MRIVLAARASSGTVTPGRSGLDDGGFIMVALLVGLTVAAVWLATLLPAWHRQAVRDREADLAGVGEQYGRALGLYYRTHCTLPMDIDLLVQDHYLRKKWTDPITNDDFRILTAEAINASSTGSTSGTQRPTPGRALGTTPAAPPTGGGPSGVYGVQRGSRATSIRIYNGQQRYNLWSFTYRTGIQALQRGGVIVAYTGSGIGATGSDQNGRG